AEEARGSRDTLKEANGNSRDNARERRRVTVYLSSTQNVSGEAGASKPLEYLSTASKFWHIGVNLSASVGETVGGSFLAAVLTNDATGESMGAHVLGISEGFSGPFPASVATSFSDATGFSTGKPMNFQDFQNTPVIYNNVGVSFFIGYSRSYITFPLKRTEPLDINVSGVTAGSPGVDASSTQGVFRFDSDSFPPTQVPIKDSDLTTQPYARTEKGEAEWTVFLETEVDNLDERRDLTELTLLDSFLASVVASQR
ncbi:MAG: hypothetical protein ACJ74Y_14460, partial [Bryobacteraceae bacterium]